MKCDYCNQETFKDKRQGKRIYCNRKCLSGGFKKWPNKGCFPKGHVPFSKGKKRTWSSPTEFKKGNFPGNGKPVGAVYINSVGRADIKVAHPNIWKRRAHYVWEMHNGKIKKGMLIHHIDGNCLNDEIANLKLMTRAEHLLIHRREFELKRKKNAAIAIRKRWKGVKSMGMRIQPPSIGAPT